MASLNPPGRPRETINHPNDPNDTEDTGNLDYNIFWDQNVTVEGISAGSYTFFINGHSHKGIMSEKCINSLGRSVYSLTGIIIAIIVIIIAVVVTIVSFGTAAPAAAAAISAAVISAGTAVAIAGVLICAAVVGGFIRAGLILIDYSTGSCSISLENPISTTLTPASLLSFAASSGITINLNDPNDKGRFSEIWSIDEGVSYLAYLESASTLLDRYNTIWNVPDYAFGPPSWADAETGDEEQKKQINKYYYQTLEILLEHGIPQDAFILAQGQVKTATYSSGKLTLGSDYLTDLATNEDLVNWGMTDGFSWLTPTTSSIIERIGTFCIDPETGSLASKYGTIPIGEPLIPVLGWSSDSILDEGLLPKFSVTMSYYDQFFTASGWRTRNRGGGFNIAIQDPSTARDVTFRDPLLAGQTITYKENGWKNKWEKESTGYYPMKLMMLTNKYAMYSIPVWPECTDAVRNNGWPELHFTIAKNGKPQEGTFKEVANGPGDELQPFGKYLFATKY